jgi:hypothetical protein
MTTAATILTCECEFVTYKGSVFCDKPATWWGTCLHCGERGPYCDSCRDRAECKGDSRLWLDICVTCHGRGMKWENMTNTSGRV